jgi:succinate-acetate transporter protein
MRFGHKYKIVVGSAFVLLGIVMQLQDMHVAISVAVMVAGMVFLVRGMRIMRRGEDVYKGDERTRKIGAFASAYSWFLTLMAIAVVFWVDYLEIFPMSSQQILGFLLFFMVFTLVFFRWYLTRKGDVQ